MDIERNWPRDPVCGLAVLPEDAASWVEYKGTRYFFCCPECRRVFEESPEEYAQERRPQEGETRQQDSPSHST